MAITFTAHNIRLDDGTFTRPDTGCSMENNGWFLAARRVLETVFPGDKRKLRLGDLGCLEGGFAVEFARMGFQVLGVDVRESNIAICNYVKSKTNLPQLEFVQDDVGNIGRYGTFDALFCCGLLYHLDAPKRCLETFSRATSKLIILQTHFSTERPLLSGRLIARLPRGARGVATRALKSRVDGFSLSRLTENEGLRGRWFTEFENDDSFSKREQKKWASWKNRRSFWIQREYLLQAIQDAGFDLVMEQFDWLGPNIAKTLQTSYPEQRRGTFIGIKTSSALPT